MNARPRRRVVGAIALLLALVMLSGCTRVVGGFASPATGAVKADAPPSDLEIINGDGSEIDQLVANSLDDITDYWAEHFESDFGETFEPIQGGIHAYDVNGTMDIPCFTDDDRKMAANNAFYCPTEDAIGYDRAFVKQLADQFGDFIVPLVMAHEFGHAIQGRIGMPKQSIAVEGQADCYAGVFTNATAQGTAHFHSTSADLDTVLGGYLMLRDEPGSSATDPGAHGSAFDRVGAFQEGFNEGAGHCLNSFGPDREYASIPYKDAADYANEGNMPYEDMLASAPAEMNQFGSLLVGDDWQEVPTNVFDAPVSCGGVGPAEEVYYCASDDTVYASSSLVQQAYDNFGDFAAMTAIALGYGSAIQEDVGASANNTEGYKARLCMVGAYAGAAFETSVTGEQSPFGTLLLSAGDLDEAVMLLIAIGQSDALINSYGLDAFERIDIFRNAVLSGRDDPVGTADACIAG